MGYVMRDHHSKILMMESKSIGNCDILVAKCLVICEALLKASQKNTQRVIIQSDVQLFLNSINGKTHVPKDIVNLVNDINNLHSHLKESGIEYCK